MLPAIEFLGKIYRGISGLGQMRLKILDTSESCQIGEERRERRGEERNRDERRGENEAVLMGWERGG